MGSGGGKSAAILVQTACVAPLRGAMCDRHLQHDRSIGKPINTNPTSRILGENSVSYAISLSEALRSHRQCWVGVHMGTVGIRLPNVSSDAEKVVGRGIWRRGRRRHGRSHHVGERRRKASRVNGGIGRGGMGEPSRPMLQLLLPEAEAERILGGDARRRHGHGVASTGMERRGVGR